MSIPESYGTSNKIVQAPATLLSIPKQKTSQELRMLSTVTLSQLSELQTVSQMSQVCRIVLRRNCERTLPHTIQNPATYRESKVAQ